MAETFRRQAQECKVHSETLALTYVHRVIFAYISVKMLDVDVI